MRISVRFALLACLMAVGLWLPMAQRVSACSCVGVTGPEAEFDWSFLFIAIGALVGLSTVVYLVARRLRVGF